MQYTYGAIFLVSLILIPFYFFQMQKKQQSEPWLFVLFVSVAIVNLGYTLTAFSKTVGFALFANKITYLGQVSLTLFNFFCFRACFLLALLLLAQLVFRSPGIARGLFLIPRKGRPQKKEF